MEERRLGIASLAFFQLSLLHSFEKAPVFDFSLVQPSSMSSEPWSPSTWRLCESAQLPEYKDQEELAKITNTIHSLPPLVHPKECDKLRSQLALACHGKAFVLWGGDCAEDFDDCGSQGIETKFKVLLQMSLVLIYEGRMPIVRIGRIAGQYAKPRTAPTETLADGTVVATYKGDMVNGAAIADREPLPQRMLEGYFRSAATLNYLRTLCNGGAASLQSASSWDMGQVLSPHLKKAYSKVVSHIVDGVSFVDVIAGSSFAPIRDSVEFFASHEGLLLEYEQALTREIEGQYYDLSAHLVWIGDRTRKIVDGRHSGHVEFCSGIQNPIAIKVGPSTSPEDAKALVRKLNQHKIPGRLTLITRFGAKKVEQSLPLIVEAVKSTGIPVVWVCDPCHGNTFAAGGVKTRNFADILTEIQLTMSVLDGMECHLGGVHLELTGENVTECVGGAAELGEKNLGEAFKSLCDPRLNYAQSLDIAFRIGHELKKKRTIN